MLAASRGQAGVDVAPRPRGRLELRALRAASAVHWIDVWCSLFFFTPTRARQSRQATSTSRALGVEPLVLQRVGAGRDEGGHQAVTPVRPRPRPRSRRFSATSSCQYSLALVVSTSNSNRSTISGTTSALST